MSRVMSEGFLIGVVSDDSAHGSEPANAGGAVHLSNLGTKNWVVLTSVIL